VSEESTAGHVPDRTKQIAELRDLAARGLIDAAEYARRRRQIVTPVEAVPYGTVPLLTALVGALVFLGMGVLILVLITQGGPWLARLLLGVVAPLGLVVGVLGLIAVPRTISAGRRAIVLDGEGFDYTTASGERFHVPWADVVTARAEEHSSADHTTKSVVLDLREPLSQFKLQRGLWPTVRKRRSSLPIPNVLLNASNEDILRLIEAHLPDGDSEGEVG
jgi:hypothetical protein